MPPRTRRRSASVPAPQPVTERPPRNPTFGLLTDAQVWCRGFQHAWYLIRSADAGFVIAGHAQTRLYFACGNGCDNAKSLIHDSMTGKRWGQSRSSPPSARVGIFPKDEFVRECLARGLIEAFAEHTRAERAGAVAAPVFSG